MKIHNLLSVGVLLASTLGAQHAVASAPVTDVQAASPTDTVEFTVYLPLRNQEQLENLLTQLHDPNSPKYQHWLQPAEFLKLFGPSAADLTSAQASLTAHGFTVTDSNAPVSYTH